MKTPRELVILNVFAAIVIGAATLVLWLAGRGFGVDLRASLAIAVAAVVFWFPGLAGIRAMVLISPASEALGERLSRGIGGVGAITCGIAVTAPFLLGLSFKHSLFVFICGGLVWWKSYAFRQNRRDMRVIRAAREAEQSPAAEGDGTDAGPSDHGR